MRQEIPEYDFRLSYTADVWNVGDRIASPVNDDSGNQFRFQGAAEVVMTTYSCEAGKEPSRFFYVRVYPFIEPLKNVTTERIAEHKGAPCLMSELPSGVSASDAPMNETRARAIMADMMRESDGALKSVRYIDWNPGDTSITMDDAFEIEELEAILWWVKNYKQCIK